MAEKSKEEIMKETLAKLVLPDVQVKIGFTREYNLGGFRNSKTFSFEIFGTAKELQNTDDVMKLISIKAEQLAGVAKKKLYSTKEKNGADGTIIMDDKE